MLVPEMNSLQIKNIVYLRQWKELPRVWAQNIMIKCRG